MFLSIAESCAARRPRNAGSGREMGFFPCPREALVGDVVGDAAASLVMLCREVRPNAVARIFVTLESRGGHFFGVVKFEKASTRPLPYDATPCLNSKGCSDAMCMPRFTCPSSPACMWTTLCLCRCMPSLESPLQSPISKSQCGRSLAITGKFWRSTTRAYTCSKLRPRVRSPCSPF